MRHKCPNCMGMLQGCNDLLCGCVLQRRGGRDFAAAMTNPPLPSMIWASHVRGRRCLGPAAVPPDMLVTVSPRWQCAFERVCAPLSIDPRTHPLCVPPYSLTHAPALTPPGLQFCSDPGLRHAYHVLTETGLSCYAHRSYGPQQLGLELVPYNAGKGWGSTVAG